MTAIPCTFSLVAINLHSPRSPLLAFLRSLSPCIRTFIPLPRAMMVIPRYIVANGCRFRALSLQGESNLSICNQTTVDQEYFQECGNPDNRVPLICNNIKYFFAHVLWHSPRLLRDGVGIYFLTPQLAGTDSDLEICIFVGLDLLKSVGIRLRLQEPWYDESPSQCPRWNRPDAFLLERVTLANRMWRNTHGSSSHKA
jgi:hypothetical protein